MIGLDTNILVRLLVADDPAQTARVKRFVDRHCTRETPGFINCVVLAELVWVLGSVYRYSRSEIADAIEDLLIGEDRVVEQHDAVRRSLTDFRSGRADFVDAVIVRINRTLGCEVTATLDRKAAMLDGAVPVP